MYPWPVPLFPFHPRQETGVLSPYPVQGPSRPRLYLLCPYLNKDNKGVDLGVQGTALQLTSRQAEPQG